MSSFTDRPIGWCEPHDGIRYAVAIPLEWEELHKGSGEWLIVPKGFVFDVSIPAWAWIAFDPHDTRYRAAACLHDYALHKLGWDRGAAAGMAFDALIADGTPRLRATIMTAAMAHGLPGRA